MPRMTSKRQLKAIRNLLTYLERTPGKLDSPATANDASRRIRVLVTLARHKRNLTKKFMEKNT